jgi:putative oxidoreductase
VTPAQLGSVWAPRLLSVLRIMAGLMFMQHGTQKLLGFPTLPAGGQPAMGTLLWFGGIIELVGGLLIAIGFFTRPAAFLASGMAAAAYFIFHASRSFYPVVNAGELAALYSFVFLYISAAGPGPWSVDALTGRNRDGSWT